MASRNGTRRIEPGPWRKGDGPRPAPPQSNRRGAKAQPERRRHRGPSWWGIIKFFFSLAVIGATALAVMIAYFASGLPSTDQLLAVKGTPSITVLDSHGQVIAARGAGVGTIIPVAEMSPFLPKAVMAIEDRRFYDHFGLDLWGLTRAAFANFAAGHVVQGGSTITQQLAKNLFLTPERTFSRKMEEAILAVWLEMKYSKDEILTLYLNRVYFGAGTYGVDAAAHRYFNKSARDVTLKEAAILAGLLKAPSRLSPSTDMDAAEDRAEVVLQTMVESGFITDDERKNADTTKPQISVAHSSPGADYFSDWVLEQVPGFIGGDPQADIIVETTLDLDMQRVAEKAVGDALEKDGQKMNIGQGALVAMDTDGGVKAMIGGRSYADSQFNRAVQAERPPGSSFKPFVYLAALEAGYTPSSTMVDAPILLKQWSPENYKHKYEGAVTLTQALAHSLNSVAIRLIVAVGPKNAVEVAKRLGIISPLHAQPSLALGTSEVNLLELTSAYAPFANGGYTAMPHGIVRIRTREGKVLYEREDSGPISVVQPTFAAEMTYMMRETVNSGTAKKAHLKDRDAAGKTGTGQSYRDAWFVGYTRDLVTGVWVGNDNNAPMNNVTGGSVPAQIWGVFMTAVSVKMPAGQLVSLEKAPAVASSAGAGWHEDTVANGGAAVQPPVDGGVGPVDQAPTDAPAPDVPEGTDFDRMLDKEFGPNGEIASNDNQPPPPKARKVSAPHGH